MKPGDIVDRGQVIGAVEHGLGAPVHSSVSGKILKITEHNNAQGRKVRSIVIENDGEDRLSPDIHPWHKKLSETYWYLTGVPELLAVAAGAFRRMGLGADDGQN